jgi:hypothetical protein
MDTASLARRIAVKELSPVEPVDAVLDRQDRLDPTLQLFTTVMPDQVREAKQIEADVAARREARPLVEVLTGECLIYTKGVPTASGRTPRPTSCLTRTTSRSSGSSPPASASAQPGPLYGALGRLVRCFVAVGLQNYTFQTSSTRSGLKGSRPGWPRCTRTASRKTFTKA